MSAITGQSPIERELQVCIVRALNLAYTDALLAAIRAMAAGVSTLQTLEGKRSKVYAQRLLAGIVELGGTI